jgi:spermidine synthase
MSLEKIYQLSADESQLLYSGEINNQTIEVRQWEEYRWLHIGDESVQTLMTLNAVDQVVLPNIQALLSVLLFCPSVKQVLNLGLGGASLERYLDSRWSEVKIRSVESNEQVIRLAKDYFNLPESVDVIHDSAEHYLLTNNDIYNIVLCDIFVADTQASCLYDNDFYENIKSCLDESGVLAINILPELEDDVIKVLVPIKNYFDYIYLLEFPEYSNAIVFATCKKLPDMDELKTRADNLFEKTELDLREIPERLNVMLEKI